MSRNEKVFHKVKPPIGYYGGKQRIATKIIKYLPKHTVYVEPFCGGAAVFFAKPLPKTTSNNHYRECLNDVDGNLVNFYQVMQSNERRALLQRIMQTPYARKCYEQARTLKQHDVVISTVDRAWAYYININMSFGNAYSGGWGVDLYGRNSAKTWENRKKRLLQAAYRLQGVYLECKDALDVIKQWDSPQTLFYCDPPYVDTRQGYVHTYSIEQYKALIVLLQQIKGSFMLSGYKTPHVPPWWPKVEFTARMSAVNGKLRKGINTRRTECLWIVDRSHTVRPTIQKLFATGKYDCFKGLHHEEI